MSYRNPYADKVEAFVNHSDAVALDMRDYQSYASCHLQGGEHTDEQCISKLIRKRKQKPPVSEYCYHGTINRDFAQSVHNLGFEPVYQSSPQVLPEAEMITLKFGSTKHFAREWNNLVYCRLSKMFCGFKDQVRARLSSETCGLYPAPAPVILVTNAG